MKSFCVKGFVYHTFTAYDGYDYYKETVTIDDEFPVQAENKRDATKKARLLAIQRGMNIKTIEEVK